MTFLANENVVFHTSRSDQAAYGCTCMMTVMTRCRLSILLKPQFHCDLWQQAVKYEVREKWKFTKGLLEELCISIKEFESNLVCMTYSFPTVTILFRLIFRSIKCCSLCNFQLVLYYKHPNEFFTPAR